MNHVEHQQERFHFEPVTVHADARGWLFEPADGATLRSMSNSHLVLTEPGAVRGNHFHPKGYEIAVVMGPGLVRVKEAGRITDITVPPGTAYRFFLPPGLPHAFKNTGDAPMILIAFNSVPHDPAQPDLVRDVLIETP